MKKVVLFSVVAMLVCFLSGPTFAQKPTRIKFKAGAVSSVVSGNLSGYKASRTFVIKVRAGQTLRTEQVGNNAITIYLTDPNGEDASDADASCNNRKEVTPTVAGDYIIKVVECQKADEWRGRFRFRVAVR